MELASGLGVETGRGLVEEQQLGPPDDADRHVEPAPLAAGEAPTRLRAWGVSPTVAIRSSTSHGRVISAVE